MNPDIKRQWVEALRSGEYVQGSGLLHSNEGYCCLGVLCDLAVKANVIDPPKEQRPRGESGWYMTYGDAPYTHNAFLPLAVQKWAGLASHDPAIIDETTLSEYNDNGTSFASIADLIERHL